MCIATLWSVIKSNEKKGELNSKQIVTHGFEFIETIECLVDFIGFSLTSIAAYYNRPHFIVKQSMSMNPDFRYIYQINSLPDLASQIQGF